MGILENFQERVQKQKGRDFLEAAMAASALAAYADGIVSLQERHRIGNILVNLRRIRIHDPRTAINILNRYVEELEADPEEATEMLLEKLRHLAGNKEAAELVAGIALSISQADGEFVYAEKMQFAEICSTLDVDPEKIEPVLHGS